MKKILIVEDDRDIAQLEKDYLEVAGFDVNVETNGVAALNKIKESMFDLVILDIMLPGMEGFQILKNIIHKKNFPVILVSAKKEEIDKLKAFEIGADDYITKPFSPNELVARVKAHIKNYEKIREMYNTTVQTKTLTVGSLQLDIDARRVFINGKEIDFPQKEFDLLLYFIKNPNRVFDREELFERVWGYDAIGGASTVTVHIGRIREKIEINPSKPEYLETVWGVGYRFKV